jgi:hypothetical protein
MLLEHAQLALGCLIHGLLLRDDEKCPLTGNIGSLSANRPRKGLALALSGTVCFVLPAIILMNVDRVPDAAMGVALVLVPIGLFVGGTLGVVQLGELLSARQPKID